MAIAEANACPFFIFFSFWPGPQLAFLFSSSEVLDGVGKDGVGWTFATADTLL